MQAQAALFDATPEAPAQAVHTLPPPGAEVIVREVGFGGREVRGVLLADPETGEIMTQTAGNGTPLAAVEEADGRTTFVAWLAGEPDLVTYEVIDAEAGAAGEAPALDHVPNEQEVAVPNDPQESVPNEAEAPPLTWAELDREAGRDPGKCPPWEARRGDRPQAVPNEQEADPLSDMAAALSAPQAPATHNGGLPLEDLLLVAQKRVGAAQAREDAAVKAYHQAQNEYMRTDEGSAAEAKAREVLRDRTEDLTAAQEATRAARREVVGAVTGCINGKRGAGGGLPSWVIPAVAIVGAVLVLGPLGLLAGAVLVWGPVKGLLTGN